MLKNFALTSLRYLLRNKSYMLMNAFGLSIGVACCLVIFVIYRLENSFDAYHAKAARTYWVVMQKQTPQGVEAISRTFYPLGAAMRQAITGIGAVTSVHWQQGYQLNLGKEKFEEKFALFVDTSYNKVFDVVWLAGNPQTALKDANAVVVTDDFARQYFGKQSPLGKTFTIDNKLEVIVRGVVAAPPFNTDHPYRILLSYAALEKYLPAGGFNSWENTGNGSTYFVLSGQGKIDNVQKQVEALKGQYLSKEEAQKTHFHFIHLEDMHFRNGEYSGYNYEFPEPVAIMLSIIAGLITIICCSNFINLATAQAIKRSKEIGIRKTLGSSRRLLTFQFLSETFLVVILSAFVGLLLARVALWKLNSSGLSGTEPEPLQFNFSQQPSILWFMLLIVVAITLFAGLYPSFVLARFKPVAVLRNQVPTGRSRGWSFRKSLIILQFFGSQTLILLTIIILNQTEYLSNKPAGFDTESVLLLNLPEDDARKATILSNNLKSIPGIEQFSFSSAYPFGGGKSVPLSVHDSLSDLQVATFYVDEKYLPTFGLKLLAGRHFFANTPKGEVIINQTLLKKIGIRTPQEAIGSAFTVNKEQIVIAGVVQDYSTDAFTKTTKPVILQYNSTHLGQVAIKLNPSQKDALVKNIGEVWQAVYPEYLYKHAWVEDALSPKYGLFNVIYDILRVFSGIAILIACLGLYNFASYIIMQRVKEIGIRKILGSTEGGIFVFLIRGFVSPVIIAFLLASPLAYMLGKASLQEFPDRIEPGIGLFLTVFSSIVLLSLMAVGYRTYRAGKINPVEVLKYD